MGKKDLAKESALARLQGRLSENEVSFSDKKVFTEEDIEDAFNAGRESVVENIPELEWERCVGGYVAETPIFNYYIEIDETDKEKYSLIVPEIDPMRFSRLREAKRVAQENYKQRIKKALGL